MGERLAAGQTPRPGPTCGLCGRTLGVGFYYTCHVCGSTYCYAHSPEKCDHRKLAVQPLKVPLRR